MRGNPAAVRPVVLLEAVSPSTPGRLIAIHGCFHGRRFWKKDYEVLAAGCRRAGFRGKIEGVFWDSFDYAGLIGNLAGMLSAVIRKKIGWKALPALPVTLSRSWKAADVAARATGLEIGRYLADLGDASSTVLLGHSLGCRAIKACLETLAVRGFKVREVHLLGAALPANESWSAALGAVDGLIWNYHSCKDPVLGFPYAGMELLGKAENLSWRFRKTPHPSGLIKGISLRPAGFSGIAHAGPRVRNVDVSAFVKSHAGFEENVHAFIRWRG